jgi:hypothetical protein
MEKSLALLVASAFLASSAVADHAIAATRLGGVKALKIHLLCAVTDPNVLLITNTSSKMISAGTKIWYDAVRIGNGQHYGGGFSTTGLLSGAIARKGVDPSSSCTAWFMRPIVNSPGP